MGLGDSEYVQQIEEERLEKDRFFKFNRQSPLPPHERERFAGLDYFPVDPSFRLVLELQEYATKETIGIQDSSNGIGHYLRWGKLSFQLNGRSGELHVYKAHPSDPSLFLPFRDETSGRETYGAGRYLDLEEGRDQTPDGLWIVDFNRAYNPFCAYSENYVCPFVPVENWLKFPVEAGEKGQTSSHM